MGRRLTASGGLGIAERPLRGFHQLRKLFALSDGEPDEPRSPVTGGGTPGQMQEGRGRWAGPRGPERCRCRAGTVTVWTAGPRAWFSFLV